MELDGLFHSPKGRIADFAQVQMHLYRHDIKLQDYFLQLQMDTLLGPRATTSVDRRATSPIRKWAFRLADTVSQCRQPQKIKTEVLFCPAPYFGRKSENQFLIRTLLGLVETGAKILCLLPANAACREELDSQLAASGRSSQVTFFDPATPFNPLEERLRRRAAAKRGRDDFWRTVQILEPFGLSPSRNIVNGFQHTASFIEAWERWAPSIEFEAVVARCHWHTLCSPVCRTGLERGKTVITFQQGVIGHTLDVPVTASKFVAFGQSSASFLKQANHRFFQAAGMPEPPVEFVNGGCLFDTLTALPDQFALQTLLLLDVPVEPGDFYGIESQGQALLLLAEKLLAENSTLRRLIIRPHPFWSTLDLEALKHLARKYSDRCELSHPAWPLEDDLRRSSVAVGILSGALAVASACGMPTVFLQTESGYTTGDLACFSPQQTLLPEAACSEIRKMLTNRQAYAAAKAVALRNAREYFANGANLNLDGPFFGRLLQTAPVTSAHVDKLK